MRVKFAMTFSTVSGIAERAGDDGKSLMKFIDDFNKRQKYYETIDLETGNKIKAFAHIRKDLYRTGKTMLEINSVTKGSLRILLMHLNIHLVVHLV